VLVADLQGQIEQSGKPCVTVSIFEGIFCWPRPCIFHAETATLKATLEGERKGHAIVLEELCSQLLLELCPRGNNKDVIIIIIVHDNVYIIC
jgi:hypothetical protein